VPLHLRAPVLRHALDACRPERHQLAEHCLAAPASMPPAIAQGTDRVQVRACIAPGRAPAALQRLTMR
jgi:hypothetical protein